MTTRSPSKLAIAYLVLGVLLVSAYGWVVHTGREWGSPKREVIPADVRSQPGGWRSFVYVGGYRGGK